MPLNEGQYNVRQYIACEQEYILEQSKESNKRIVLC